MRARKLPRITGHGTPKYFGTRFHNNYQYNKLATLRTAIETRIDVYVLDNCCLRENFVNLEAFLA